MNDPIKIIWKWKNNNRRIQYNTYIFIGDLVPKDIIKILDTFASMNLYDTLISLQKSEYNKLEKFYGEKWYEKFFNVYHINSSINIIKESKTRKKELEEKYGSEWFEKHINMRKLIEKEIIYSYESQIRYENQYKKLKERNFGGDEDLNEDYRTMKNNIIKKTENFEKENYGYESDLNINSSTKFNSDSDINSDLDSDSDINLDSDTILESNSEQKIIQHGGNKNIEAINSFKINVINNNLSGGYDDENIDYIDKDNEIPESDDENNINYLEEGEQELYDDSDDDIQDEIQDEKDELDYESILQEEDVDEKISETNKLLKKALNDDKIIEKKISKMIEFDNTNNDNQYDNNLKDTYEKFYVKSQYIFKDDTIKNMRNKICCTLKCNDIFGDELYLTPSRQYFWIEYFYDNVINKISVGQKWMRRNELLSLDIEPNNNMKVYEELRGPLKLLRNNLKRYNNKIHLDDDNNNILYDYNNYLVNNEIYMIDIYNELGTNFKTNSENIKNLQDLYLRLYFPRIKSEDIKSIVDLLNKTNNVEMQKNVAIFETINNDLLLENEIVETVEKVRTGEKYEYLFKENYITQSVIHVGLRFNSRNMNKINLYKIFNTFELSEKYPFIQYQTLDGNIIYKFSEKHLTEYFSRKENNDVLTKWFENSTYGLNVKTKSMDSHGINFRSINLSENGKIDYKIQKKEEDMATIEDIKKTYVDIYSLIEKLNLENNDVKFEIPHETEFKYAFINAIQKFELPEKFRINHNDLSDFARFFFPYVAMQIEPKKRESKMSLSANDKSKFGTYLRYKKVSKYENQARIEQRIMYLIKNYEFSEKELILELSKQFNITEQKAYEEYIRVKNLYPNLKKTRKALKKLENLPKYKPPGIGIDIQGKEPTKYKIRISGARDKTQLNRIISFMNILIHLYVETYLYKRPEKQALKKKLDKLNHIAKRRNKVSEFVKYVSKSNTIKLMTKLDTRLNYKPEKGQSGYSRACQNSGDNKKRRPQQYISDNMNEMLKKGYYLNKKTGIYERKISYKEKGKKKETVIQAVKLTDYDNDGNLTGKDIFYTCDPEDNGEHFYIGFLTKIKNPKTGQCLTCCFKKEQMNPTGKKKKEFIDNCLNEKNRGIEKVSFTDLGDKLYILQDSNRLGDGRVGYLPKYLDIYFNYILGKRNVRKHHYLDSAENGYFFKYGVKHGENPFLQVIANILDISYKNLIEKIIKFLENDKNMQYFTSLNNGDIRTKFNKIEDFIFYIKNSDNLDFNLVGDLISIPGVCSKNGLNIVVFIKKVIVINDNLAYEKEKIREDFYLECRNSENIIGLTDSKKDCIFIINEDDSYFPIVMITKKMDEKHEITKKFTYDKEKNNIVKHVNDYYEKSCIAQMMDKRNIGISAKVSNLIMENIKDENYSIKSQFIDGKNKCKFLITKNDILIPVFPSGSIYNIPIVKNITKYLKSYEDTLKQLEEIYDMTDKKLPLKQIGVFYDRTNDESEDNKIIVSAIMTEANYLVPIQKKEFTRTFFENKKMIMDVNPQIDEIDESIENGTFIIDNRIKYVNKWKYLSETYELFRYEFSNFVNDPENKNIKTKLQVIINNNKISKKEKLIKIKLILYKLVDDELYQKYKETVGKEMNEMEGGGKLLHVDDKMPNLDKYIVQNERNLCKIYDNKDKCSLNPHCKWYHSSCSFISTTDNTIKMVNKMADELVANEMNAFELLQINNYYVHDIDDYNKFTEKEGQRIVKSTSSNINKVLAETFGKDRIFYKPGKKRTKNIESNYQELNQQNQMIDMKKYYLQKIIPDNMNLFRTYANCYYWNQNKYSDLQIRNLGFYSPLQTEIAITFRSYVINWILNYSNRKKLLNNDELKKYLVNGKENFNDYLERFIIKLVNEIEHNTNCILELYVMNKINDIPIVIYDEYQTILYVFDDGIKRNDKNFEKYTKNTDCINLRFIFKNSNDVIPDKIDAIYYNK